jgi:hypothetical protein
MKPFSQIRMRFATLVCAVAVTSIWAAEAPANTDKTGGAAAPTTVSTRAPSAGLNLLSGPRPSQLRVQVRSMGSGRWICSPAGFGQRSRCYRN